MPICKCCKEELGESNCSKCVINWGECCKRKEQFMANFTKEYKKEHDKNPPQRTRRATLYTYYHTIPLHSGKNHE